MNPFDHLIKPIITSPPEGVAMYCPTHILYQCAKFGDDRTPFNVIFWRVRRLTCKRPIPIFNLAKQGYCNHFVCLSWRVWTSWRIFWRHDVFSTSWRICWRHDMLWTSWRTFWRHDVFFWTPWRDALFDVMTYFGRHDTFLDIMTFLGRHDAFFDVMTWFGCHDALFDVIKCFGRHDVFLDVMTCFGRHDALFWRHDVFWTSWHFLTSSCDLDVITHFLTSWRVLEERKFLHHLW